MDALLSVNWTALIVLIIALLMFRALNWIAYKVNWTFVILISMVMGAVIGIVFASEGNSYMTWLSLLGNIYVNLIKALVAPVVLISVISGLIQLNDKEKMKRIGTRSVFWLMFSSAAAIVITVVFGGLTKIGKGAGAVFADISNVSGSTLEAYQEMETSFDQIILKLFPTNIAGDLAADNIVAIIIIAVAIAVAYVSVSAKEGEDKVKSFKDLIEAVKKIVFYILSYVIDLTPYAVLCLTAVSASQLSSDKEALVQVILLVAMIYAVCLVQTYIVNALILKFAAKLSPLRFFQKTFDAQATAFTTQSSVGSLPITIDRLIRKVGVDEEVANFTAPLGTTIGMAGCTCIWPILLAMFYLNATGQHWEASQYLVMCFMCLVLAMGSAGMPGIGIVTAVSLFSAVDLPIAAVVLLMPINSISDMARTLTNVVGANVAAAVVARKTGLLDDSVFDAEDGSPKKKEAEAGSKSQRLH